MKSLSRPLSRCTSSQVGRGWSNHLHAPLFVTRVLFGLSRPIGQSLIRALRHIIEFDSGLLIKSSDLQVYPGTMTPAG
jgi:hypothetical protein